MEKIYSIENEWARAVLLLLVSPYVLFNYLIYRCTKKARLIICAIILVLVTMICTLYAVSLFSKITAERTIIDCSAAFSTGNLRPTTEYVVIHHIASRQGSVNDICNVHFGEHKWSTIGYHYYVRKDGSIIQLKPDNEVAPHALYFNNTCVAICLEGNFSDEFIEDTQKEALIYITDKMLKKYNLTADNIKGHGELKGNNTECPGTKLNIEEIRKCLR